MSNNDAAIRIKWHRYAASLWGDHWIVGRKTEKRIRQASRWDAGTQTYIPPRFVPRESYLEARAKFLEDQLDGRCDLGNTDEVAALKADNEALRCQLLKIENELQEESGHAYEIKTYIKPDVKRALTYVRMARGDTRYLADVETILENIIAGRG